MSDERETSDHVRGAPALLAIIRAARAIGDRDLEQAAKRQLRDEYGIEVSFRRQEREAANA
jgi:hypothetical protein